MLTPSERVHLILEIGRRLGAQPWTLIDLTLRQFGQRTSDRWEGTAEAYAATMVEDAPAETLIDLARHLGYVDSARVTGPQPSFWQEGRLRLFVSHLAQHKGYAGQLRAELESYGVSAFVAHTDIRPLAEWQEEIELGLATADAMVALLHERFHESNWTDQELGYAMGREILVVMVRLGQDPYGFVGRFQAVAGNDKTAGALARELAELLVKNKRTGPRMTEALVVGLERSKSFVETRALVPILQLSTWGSAALAGRCLKAIQDNDQVGKSWGQPEAIRQLVDRWSAA